MEFEEESSASPLDESQEALPFDEETFGQNEDDEEEEEFVFPKFHSGPSLHTNEATSLSSPTISLTPSAKRKRGRPCKLKPQVLETTSIVPSKCKDSPAPRKRGRPPGTGKKRTLAASRSTNSSRESLSLDSGDSSSPGQSSNLFNSSPFTFGRSASFSGFEDDTKVKRGRGRPRKNFPLPSVDMISYHQQLQLKESPLGGSICPKLPTDLEISEYVKELVAPKKINSISSPSNSSNLNLNPVSDPPLTSTSSSSIILTSSPKDQYIGISRTHSFQRESSNDSFEEDNDETDLNEYKVKRRLFREDDEDVTRAKNDHNSSQTNTEDIWEDASKSNLQRPQDEKEEEDNPATPKSTSLVSDIYCSLANKKISSCGLDDVMTQLEHHFAVELRCRRFFISEVYDILCCQTCP